MLQYLILDGCLSLAPCCSAGDASDTSNSNDSVQKVHKEQPGEVGPNISLLAKELQTQWHVKHNMHLGNSVIRPNSHRKVWWSCNQCPEGLPHVWGSRVDNRTQGRGCPFCSGTAVCQHNTLAQKAPKIALFWDAKKNQPLSPDQVTVFSSMRAYWKCNACWHELRFMARLGAPSVQRQTAAGKQTAQGRSTLLLQRQIMPCCSNGTMTETVTTETSLTTQRCKAASRFGGVAMNVQKARYTAGRLPRINEMARLQEDALVVLGTSCVSATLWKLCVLMLLLTLTLKKMVSVLLKSQVQQPQSTAGCQISLEPRSVLWLCAQPTGSDPI